MKQIVFFILLLLTSLAACAQPVTRIRLITLQDPPDTTTQYFIQAGGGKDTIKYVPIDTILNELGVYNLTTDFVPQWNGSTFVDSDIEWGGDLMTIGFGSLDVDIVPADNVNIDALNIQIGGTTSTAQINVNDSNAKIEIGNNPDSINVDGPLYLIGGVNDYGGANDVESRIDSLYDNAGAGADGDGIKDATTGLPGGDVTIDAGTNDLIIGNLDSLNFQANNGIGLISPDIWFSQSGLFTTTWHLSTYNNWSGTGYWTTTIDYINFTADDSLRIILDNISATKQISIGGLRLDKFGGLKLTHFPSSFSTYTNTDDEGRIVYNSTDNVPMFWDGSAWTNLTTGTIPAAATEGYAVVETASPDVQSITTTWEALEAQTSAGLSSGWSFSTSTDLLTYSGSTAKYLVSFSACFTQPTSSLYTYTFTVRENGTDGNAKAVAVTSGADADPSYCVSGFDVVTANSSDTFGLGFISSGASINATIQSSQLVMTKLVGQ